MDKYLKEFKGGNPVYKMLDGFGRPGRKVETIDNDIGDYISSCLYPLKNCIDRMISEGEDGDAIFDFAHILDRLYDAAYTQLEKMDEAIYTHMGWIKITTTNENIRGGLMQQDFLGVYVGKEPDDKAVNA
jgi:hypothetical protein